MHPAQLASIHRLSLENAAAAYEAGLVDLAAEWLARVPAKMRPSSLAGAVHYALARRAASDQRWAQAIVEMRSAEDADPRNGHYQRRLALMRGRQPLMKDGAWATMAAQVDPPSRLPLDALVPEVVSVHACGAYYSRGSGRAAPWSRYLRKSKTPEPDPIERAAVLKLASDYFCRFLAERTPLLAVAEVVVPIPANPERYLVRMGSLPDELARAVQNQLAIPAVLLGLERKSTDVEMKRLSSASERRAAANQTYAPGPERSLFEGRAVLLVDDVITTGSTLRAAAQVLRDAGAATVIAAALSHTEG